MGATISDACLAPGLRYNSVVRPRIERLVAEYPDRVTVEEFQAIDQERDLEQLLNFRGDKIRRIRSLVQLLLDDDVSTTGDFVIWLDEEGTRLDVTSLPGIKDKTWDYLRVLVGLPSTPVDRHLRKFLAWALADGYPRHNPDSERIDALKVAYRVVADIYKCAAMKLGVSEAALDHEVWQYMSTHYSGPPPASGL
jgi:hypothetical protein